MTNKKERINSKMIKIIFFVVLISISSISILATNIHSAQAVQSNIILEKIQEIKDRSNFKESINADDIKEKQKFFQRLNLANELVTLQSRGLSDSQKAAEVMQQIRDMFAEYTPIVVEDFPPPIGVKELGTEQPLLYAEPIQNLEIIHANPSNTLGAYVYREYDTSDVSRTSCGIFQIGDSNGSITAYSTYSYLKGNLISSQDYPMTIWNTCQLKTFDDGAIFYYNFEEPWNSCVQLFDSTHYTRGGICSGITADHLILVDATANYQGTEFSSVHGIQWIVL